MEIGVGLRQRPLARVELNAKETVALYAKVTQETREMFKTMQSENFNVTKHDEKYCKIREIRNDLAKEILENYPLHREFVNQISREFFISKKTMEKQVVYSESVANKQREIAAMMKDVGVIAVERKEIALKLILVQEQWKPIKI